MARGAEPGWTFAQQKCERAAAARLIDKSCHASGEEPPSIAVTFWNMDCIRYIAHGYHLFSIRSIMAILDHEYNIA